MKRFKVVTITSTFLMIALGSLGQTIAKRWQTAGRLINGKISQLDLKSMEYDFSKGDEYYVYEKGTLIESGTYILAKDKKSVLFKDGNKSQSVKIVKLKETELRMIMSSPFGGNDTLVCYPSNGTQGRNAKKKIIDYKALQQKWAAMQYSDFGFAQYLGMLIQDTRDKWSETMNFSKCQEDEKELRNYGRYETLPDENAFEKYRGLQGGLDMCSTLLLDFLKTNYPNLRQNKPFSDETYSVVEDLKNRMVQLEKVRADFDIAYETYNQP